MAPNTSRVGGSVCLAEESVVAPSFDNVLSAPVTTKREHAILFFDWGESAIPVPSAETESESHVMALVCLH